MIDYLAAEPQTDADATFRNFQRYNLGRAAEHFGVTVTCVPSFGWRLRSIGASVAGEHGVCWLRVVSEEPQWAQGYAWTGNLDANTITNIVKPRVLDVFEWSEREWRNQRAEVMTLVPGEPCSPTDGDDVDTTVVRWATAHGDMHWSNLMRPRLGVLDWELWGVAPAGTDAATLLCYSLRVPEVAERVRAVFADLLDTPTGRVAQLYVVARLLRRIDGGDHPELAEPLAAYARDL